MTAMAKLPPDERGVHPVLGRRGNCRRRRTPSSALTLEQRPTPADPSQGQPSTGRHSRKIGLGLPEAAQWARAEPLLRECLAIREKVEAGDWRTFNTKSMLGGALLGQKKYVDAESLLLVGYQGMKEREKAIPPLARDRLPEAVERLVQLYEATAKKDEAAKWQTELEKLKPSAKRDK